MRLILSRKLEKTAIVVQYRLLHYRLELFEQLRRACHDRGIRLEVVVGQATRRERPRADEGELSWARKVVNRVWEIGDRDWVWQPLPADLRHAELVIVMQESRLLSNYALLLRRALGSDQRVAYWGHGRNFQSQTPSGLRERWKRFMLTRVDWWFAYTEKSAALVRAAGYQAERITCLNNAIDSGKFRADLANCTDLQLSVARAELGLALGDSVALFCGSLYSDKRLDLLVSAAELIHGTNPNFTLLVIGDGPLRPAMQEIAASRPWIKILGVRKGHEKAIFFRLADVVLNPGAVGLHIVDAFCAGLVLITTKAAKHGPEVAYLEDGVNGLYAGDTADSYAHAVLGLLADTERLNGMKRAALADASRYSLASMVHNFAVGIEKALAAKEASR